MTSKIEVENYILHFSWQIKVISWLIKYFKCYSINYYWKASAYQLLKAQYFTLKIKIDSYRTTIMSI